MSAACLTACIGLLTSCSGDKVINVDKTAQIYPDYTGITIPPNIAPLNFKINENTGPYVITISGNGSEIIVRSRSGKVRIPESKWHRILGSAKGGELVIRIRARNKGRPLIYPPVINTVAIEPIDSYIAYRLIDPGFELWNEMGIYQRCLENFREKPVLLNRMIGHNCINCHSFSSNNSSRMMFHVRGANGGTIICSDGSLRKTDTKTEKTISAGVYPSWHPDGKLIAFSVNNIIQTFHSVNHIRTEVTDTLSDLIVYDAERNLVFSPPEISSPEKFETFPSWSPDGKYLYYCSAAALPYTRVKNIRYDILRVPFDMDTFEAGAPDTVVNASQSGKSTSFPRISPDGRYLMYCQLDYGNFSIWHRESDILINDLQTGKTIDPPINSEDTESYHSWSSSGRWIIFSSRRSDGLHTQLFLSYFDAEGNAHKPFLLPQKDPEFHDTFLKSFNVPEFITSPVDVIPRRLKKVIIER